jgi:superfamily II DNA or RNA helicase
MNMAAVMITEAEDALRRVVGTGPLLRARAYLERGDVLAVQGSSSIGHVMGTIRDGGEVHSAFAVSGPRPGHIVGTVRGSCTCRAPGLCDHAVALLLASMPRPRATASGSPTPDWERSLLAAVPPGSASQETARPEIALQFELVPDPSVRRPMATAPYRIALRPVVPGRAAPWIRTGISWSTLGSTHHRASSRWHERHRQLLGELLTLACDPRKAYYYSYSSPAALYLESVTSRRVWDLLAEAQEIGLPLVLPDRHATPVVVHSRPAQLAMRVARSDAGLDLVPGVELDGEALPLGTSLLLGDPAHGIAWWQTAGGADAAPLPPLRIARLTGAVDPGLRRLLAAGPIAVPVRDEERFLRTYYPALRRRVALVPADESLALPTESPPVLTLAARRLSGHRMHLAWSWNYRLGDVERREPLEEPPGLRLAGGRDRDAESVVLARVAELVAHVPELMEESGPGRRLAPSVTVAGMATVRVLADVLPALSTVPDVEVTVQLDEALQAGVPTYRPAGEEPVIRLSGAPAEGDRDWFDLAVEVSVEGEQVPFADLFRALALDEEFLLLPSGTYFSLDREELRQLAILIAEARALQDGPADTVRLNRFQAGLWEELDRIGIVDGQAAAWQQSVRALTEAADAVPYAVPDTLRATLRPYQLAGFNWLCALYDHGLGGVLADDMGLGKTLQVLALMEHVRSRGLAAGPFLVVVPTSVMFNWASEAARFAPELRIATVAETRARRGLDLSDVVAGADLVITSYTLFRLEYDDYAAANWAGLVLDEAQSVKNHQSRGYQCARRLPAPFKLAITGTPLENNLMELWSLLSITAPGLFANPARFTEYYRWPIERGGDAELLAQLRRRIKPLMLRRTKDQVAADLPDKQEQVLELELSPQHRKVYQTYLQRERQKVLGLLPDMVRNRFEIFRSLTLLRQASLDVSLVDGRHAKVPSTKLDAFLEQVADIVGEGHRTLVFSQFTRFLRAAGDRLAGAGIDYCYLDGRTRDRQAVLAQFKNGTTPVFLISLKAGGFGLNLTEADYCILLDPWWNPAVESQAVDRVHRIGQRRKVMVYRLVAKDTIEEKVMALKAAKQDLFDSVLSDGSFASASLTASDVRALLE